MKHLYIHFMFDFLQKEFINEPEKASDYVKNIIDKTKNQVSSSKHQIDWLELITIVNFIMF